MVSSSYYHIHFAQFNVCINVHCCKFENEVTVGYYLHYRLYACSLGVSEVQVLGESLKFTSKLR